MILRYLALPIMICATIYMLGGPAKRAQINGRLAAFAATVAEPVAQLLGRSETLQKRLHLSDPRIEPTSGVVRLSDLPVAAEVPVVRLQDLPEIEGTKHVRLSELPEPVENTVYFLRQDEEAALPAVAVSLRPMPRRDVCAGNPLAVPVILPVALSGSARPGDAL